MKKYFSLFKNISLLALLGALLGGCISSGSSKDLYGPPIDPQVAAQANLQADVEGLKSQVQNMRAQMEDIQGSSKESGGETMQSLSEKIARLESQLAMMASQMAINLEGTGGPYQQNTGQQPAEDVENNYTEPQNQSQNLYLPPMQPTQPSSSTEPPPVHTETTGQESPADVMYDQAMGAFNSKNYDQAIQLWGEMVKAYPKSAKASNAIFWQGECYFQKGDYVQAVLSYQDVLDKYPSSPKTPACMLKQGYAFKRMGKSPAATEIWTKLIRQFPNASESQRAKTLLAGS